MQQFEATVAWERAGHPFTDQRYSRAHEWVFDGGLHVPASSSPLSVPLPMSEAANIDPEEALVAAVSSCHMLFFLAIAAQRGFIIDSYRDHALGVMERDVEGKLSMTRISLRPALAFAGQRAPSEVELASMHHAAHDQCYIANSIKAAVTIENTA